MQIILHNEDNDRERVLHQTVYSRARYVVAEAIDLANLFSAKLEYWVPDKISYYRVIDDVAFVHEVEIRNGGIE